jgi:hypothetical protein
MASIAMMGLPSAECKLASAKLAPANLAGTKLARPSVLDDPHKWQTV